ncbi:bacteriohemerythrin [Cupriavidus sp. CV2]|uniref:bacteriohemerythrin n=1 Tax=Cupriavidus ulmosensis TaxID=3065913 RepID=UPI00296A9CD8|nr:bacteriohemerythrin [Cupriavidus sp. CV2]MDW3687258.1 bacteriohemerythrin [Cupriavidus sp. CV2]
MTDSSSPSTATLAPDLLLGEPVTDATHAEFVQLLDAATRADDAGFLAALDEWIDHTRHHFGQEEAWMEAMAFGPQHCHRGEHEQVLAVAGAVRDKVAAGDLALGRRLLSELPGWFDQHVKAMDAMMVNHMRENGFSLIEAPAEQAA